MLSLLICTLPVLFPWLQLPLVWLLPFCGKKKRKRAHILSAVV
ncbi:hypothetical protein AB205_0053940 [Aquarana catesbeiana]|uniref:Uncharacterized protein n=1 Tax=Aquarana catesbeiana TaxID=8400 RepID=A0A2G9SAP3_AQUCT|nr:hypothetical protein AB205_0053940 [Aquarana catesbeiana]